MKRPVPAGVRRGSLPALERRLAVGHERGDALDEVLGLYHRLLGERLLAERLLERAVVAPVDQAPGGGDGLRRSAGKRLGAVGDEAVQLLARDDLVSDAQLDGLGGVDAVAGDQQPQRRPGADQPRQDVGRAGVGRQSDVVKPHSKKASSAG